MMAKGSNKLQEQEKIVKKKIWKARFNKDAHCLPEHDKVKKKSPKNDVQKPLDRIRCTGSQKERNVAQQINKLQDRNPPQAVSAQISEVTKREQAEVCQTKLIRSPALERMKKSEVKVLRRLQHTSVTRRKRNMVPLQPTLLNITVPLPFTYDENQATRRTTSRAQAHPVEMAKQSRLKTPQAQQHGLSALAIQLPPKQRLGEVTELLVTANSNVPAGEGEGDYKREDVTQTVVTERAGETNYLQEDDVTQNVITEVSESTKPRFITHKQVSLFENWRPGSQKLDKLPPSVDRDYCLRVEIEKQQDRRLARKIAMRKKEMRNFRRFEGAGVDDANFTPVSKDSSQSIANFTIREDVEESARGYAQFLYRPGAAWRNLGSDSASLRNFGPPETESRPKSCEGRKSTTEIVLAISSASARREALRKGLAERLREGHLRKKLLVSQNRAGSRHSQCRCC